MLGIFPTVSFAAPNTENIIILYENDVHCAVEGYSKLSAMKKELQERYAYVGVFSVGDYIQGSSFGAISQGEYIVELMNLVGYDTLTLGNHEFDYRILCKNVGAAGYGFVSHRQQYFKRCSLIQCCPYKCYCCDISQKSQL